jgi:M6 family metalloprotease-like protein
MKNTTSVTRRPRAFALSFVAALCATLLFATPASAQYPEPPPDFVHGATPLKPDFSPEGGSTDRPLLILFIEFTDVVTPVGIDDDWVADRFFGPSRSVVDYFTQMSGGELAFTPATESVGMPDDGVVNIVIGTYGAHVAVNSANEAGQALQAAESLVDFAQFDTPPYDGVIDDRELTVVAIRVSNPPSGRSDNGGVNRSPDYSGWPAGFTTIDGKTIDFTVSIAWTLTNKMTIAHEIGHSVIDLRDLYGFGAGALALGGTTCCGAEWWREPTAFELMHVGWGTPEVVVEDGFYPVDFSDIYVLYDYDRGVDDFFLVENRRNGSPTSYDQSAADSGLVIWRVDESVWPGPVDAQRPLELMRPDGVRIPGCSDDDLDGADDEDYCDPACPAGMPCVCGFNDDGDVDDEGNPVIDEDPPGPGCYVGSPADAWDPSDPATPQRTMNRTWFDQTPSGLAVRAIDRPGTYSTRAYFDVRGPGVLVDAYGFRGGAPPIVRGCLDNSALLPVRNTDDPGQPDDTFDFTLESALGLAGDDGYANPDAAGRLVGLGGDHADPASGLRDLYVAGPRHVADRSDHRYDGSVHRASPRLRRGQCRRWMRQLYLGGEPRPRRRGRRRRRRRV